MSGISGDPKPPRRPKPDGSRSGPIDEPGDSSTFKPNPNRKAGTKTRSSTSRAKEFDPGKGPSFWERIFFGRVSSGQLAQFCRQFSAYMNAGVDISKALGNLQTQFASTALGPVIGRLSAAVKRGDTLGEAVTREPKAFDAMFVGMVKVAEARGGIPETMKMLSRHYESRQTLIRQARSAMIYPIAVLMIAACVVTLMSLWILPMFASMLRDIAGKSASLPLPSRMMLAFSDFVQWIGWLVIPLVLIGTPVLLFQMYKTENGKRVLDRVLMRIPVLGQLMKKIDTTRFARSLSTLLDAGVDVGASMDLTADVLRLEPFQVAVRSARSQVIHGGELSVALNKTRRFGADVIAVIEAGEETGKLPESLNHLADDYEEQVAYMVRNMGQLIQPLLMIMLGGIVLFIILAVLLPYISIITSLTGGG